MISIKKIDNGLMSFLTTVRYPKRLKTPFSQFLFAAGFNLLMAALFVSGDLIDDGQVERFSYALVSAFLLAIFYHWRLWRKLEKSQTQDI